MTVSTQLLLASGHNCRTSTNAGGNGRGFYFENKKLFIVRSRPRAERTHAVHRRRSPSAISVEMLFIPWLPTGYEKSLLVAIRLVRWHRFKGNFIVFHVRTLNCVYSYDIRWLVTNKFRFIVTSVYCRRSFNFTLRVSPCSRQARNITFSTYSIHVHLRSTRLTLYAHVRPADVVCFVYQYFYIFSVGINFRGKSTFFLV